MRNLLRFIVQSGNFLLMIALEIAALVLVFRYNPYQQSRFWNSANAVIGRMNAWGADVAEYFYLDTENARLAEENAALRSRLSGTGERGGGLPMVYQSAKVVDFTGNGKQNYLTIDKGLSDGVRAGQGVVSDEGVVGIVQTASAHFALVVPVTHSKTHLSARIKKNDYLCFTSWQGPSLRYATLSDVARHVDVAVGDTIVTSGLTGVFEEGIPIGVVSMAELNESDSYYRIEIALATDMKRINYVQVVGSVWKEEMDSLQVHGIH